MKGKIFTILGIIFILLSAGAYILFEAYVKDSSNLTAINVVVAKQDIPEDTVIHNMDEAKQLFEVKRMSASDIVSGAVTVSDASNVDGSIFGKLSSYFSKSEPDEAQLSQFVNLKITRAYVKNEQIIANFTSTDTMEFADDERIFTPEKLSNISPAMATELHKGDYVDLWIVTKDEITGEISAKSFYGPLMIYKLKDGDSNELLGGNTSAAISLIFKLPNKDIANITARLQQQDCIGCFVVKYGKRPTEEQLQATYLETNTVTNTQTTVNEVPVEVPVDVTIEVNDIENENTSTDEVTTTDTEVTTTEIEQN